MSFYQSRSRELDVATRYMEYRLSARSQWARILHRRPVVGSRAHPHLSVAFALGRDGGPAIAVPTALGYLLGGILFFLLVFASSALSGPATGYTPVVRLAVLRAAGTALVAGVAWRSGIPYPQWAGIVVILSVRPDQMAALRLTTRRVIGSTAG
jgi:hypothetical protein